jgi:hypothetical protein
VKPDLRYQRVIPWEVEVEIYFWPRIDWFNLNLFRKMRYELISLYHTPAGYFITEDIVSTCSNTRVVWSSDPHEWCHEQATVLNYYSAKLRWLWRRGLIPLGQKDPVELYCSLTLFCTIQLSSVGGREIDNVTPLFELWQNLPGNHENWFGESVRWAVLLGRYPAKV